MTTPSARIGGTALAALLPPLRNVPGPVYSALAGAVRTLVLDGRVASGTRLPSERELALALRVSRATVTAAYDTLREDGFLASRVGAGSHVAVPERYTPHAGHTGWRTTGATSDPLAGDVVDLTVAAVPASPELAPALADAVRAAEPYLRGTGYEPSGLPALRAAVAERFTARGVPTDPEQVLITNGTLHGTDLLLRLLLSPGERVLTELPAYPGTLDAVRAHHGRLVPVPMAPGSGWDVDQLRSALGQSAPRMAYLMPDFHNPTGALVPTADRRAVVAAARRTGTLLLVDEAFLDLGFRDTRRDLPSPMAALDPGVVTVGSLSKTVWAGLRIGWLRAAPELVRRLAALRTSIDLCAPVVEQLAVAALLPRIDELAAARAAMLEGQCDVLLDALARELPAWRTTRPAGGLSTWIELDAPVSTPLTVAAAGLGVQLAPGSRFGVDGTLERFLRLPFALPAPRLAEAVSRLARARDQLGSVPRAASPAVVT
ncbi:aminotransferase-like domain-containing protein [Jatrophihabitans fulvus]